MSRNSRLDVIRVLLVDDDEEDYLIIKHLFGLMSTIRCELDWVASSEAALTAIDARSTTRTSWIIASTGARDSMCCMKSTPMRAPSHLSFSRA